MCLGLNHGMVGCNADCHLKAPSWRRKEANKKRRMARKVGRWTMDQRPRSLDLGHDAVFDFLGRFSCSPVPSMLGFIFLIHSSLLWSMYGVMDVEAVVDYLSTSSVFTPVVAVFYFQWEYHRESVLLESRRYNSVSTINHRFLACQFISIY
jgi:hypothetical protein